MSLLPAVGVVSYGGVTFPTAFHTHIEHRPIYSSDSRTIKFVSLILTVECVVTDTNELDLDNTRTILSTPKLTLTITDIGFTDLVISQANDLHFGPKPEVLSWRPLGANKAAHLVWRIECILKPDDCVATFGMLAEFSYGIEFATQPNGRTTRFINGYAEIIGNTTGVLVKRQNYTIDDSWEKIVPRYIPGFKREINRSLSPNKLGMTFQIIDRQIDSDQPYPAGMTNCQMRHKVSSGGPLISSVQQWNITLSGSFTVAPAYPKAAAWNVFLGVLRDRLRDALLARNTSGYNNDKYNTGFFIPQRLEIESQVFGQEVSFSVSYILMSDFPSLLAASGLWKPLNNMDWQTWANSMDLLIGKFGSAGLKHRSQDDYIINICNNQLSPNESLLPNLRQTAPGVPGIFGGIKPPKGKSYLDWRCWVEVQRETTVVSQHPTGYGDADKRGEQDSLFKSLGMGIGGQPGVDAYINNLGASTTTRQIQNPSASKYTATLTGFAFRVGYPVEHIPALVSVGGQAAILKSDHTMANQVVGNLLGVPIYRAIWRREYIVGAFTPANATYTGVPAGASIVVRD